MILPSTTFKTASILRHTSFGCVAPPKKVLYSFTVNAKNTTKYAFVWNQSICTQGHVYDVGSKCESASEKLLSWSHSSISTTFIQHRGHILTPSSISSVPMLQPSTHTERQEWRQGKIMLSLRLQTGSVVNKIPTSWQIQCFLCSAENIGLKRPLLLFVPHRSVNFYSPEATTYTLRFSKCSTAIPATAQIVTW